MASFESPSISRTERRSPSPLPYPQKRSVSPLYHPQKRSVSPLSHRLASPRHVTHTHFASSSESSSPYYHSFQRAKSLRQLLTELQRKDSELSNLLRAPGARHVPKFIDQGFEGVVGKQALITAYQNFVGSLVSLVAQSVFLEHPDRLSDEDDPHHVVRALHRKTCPDMNIFCRLVTDPATVAGVHPQSDSSKMIKGVPVNQLARFCDVSVLRFLSQVNEHTKPHSILWAIDYTIHLLNTLTNSLLMHSTVGWYGAPSTRKKKVTSIGAPHHSAFPPPIPAPPTVVVVGSPTAHSSHLDPVTGQPSLLGDQTQFQFPPSRTFAQPSHLVAGAHSTGGRLGADIEGRRHQHPPSNLSLEGQIEGARSSPSPTEFTSPSWSSEGSPPTSLRHHEEGLVDRVGSDAVGRELTLMPPPSHLHLDAPRSPRLADIRVSTPQSIPEEDEEDEEEEGERGGGGTEGGQRRWRGPTPEYGSFESEGSKEEEEEEEEVRKKPLGAEEEIPNVDIKKELEVLMNAEGRISLVAILQAIARLPQSEDIWTEKLGTQCFTLIQLCMELGLTQRSRGDESMTMKRRRFQKQENIAFRAHGKEHPSRIHSKYVVHYAIHALIQCGTNLMVGCTHESDQTCCLSYKRLATQKDSIHSKLLRHLKRIHLHSPQDFQQVMMSFASAASIRRVFQFLHVVLQYCQRAPTDNVDTLLLSIVSSVLRILVDRLTQLDLSKPALRSDCLEACLFFQYAQHLFNFPTFTQLDSYRHIHMYIHRIALSVILPADTPPQHSKVDSVLDPSVLPFSSLLEEAGTPQLSESSPTTSQPSPALQMSHKIAQSLPRKLAKQGTSVPTEMDARSRSTVFPQEHGASKSPKAHRRGLFTKQHSIHEDSSPNMDGREVSGYLEEWRGLKMEVLRHRIQRLVVLMDLSEPGTVPDPGMLASLVDLSDGTLVVARAMVLLECALFVHNLRDKENKKPSHWLQVNKDTHNIAMSLKRWAEAIGEKLRVVELRERDMTQQMRAKGAKGSIVLPEEPVLPDVQPVGEREGVVGTKFQTISFGIKMAACVLLYEITHFLRDSPSAPPFSPLSTPRVSVTNLDDRRQSVVSGASTDTEAVLTPTYSPGASLHPSPEKRPPMLGLASSHSGSFDEEVSHDGRSGSFEDEFLSLNVRSPRQKRVSVYLRVNSAVEGGESGRGRLNSALKQTVNVRFASTSNEPSPQRRSSLAAPVSVGRRHVSFHEANRPPRRKRTSAVTTGTLHPIPKKPSIPSSQSFQDYVPDATTPDVPNRPPLLQQASTASQRSINIGSQIQHGISRLRTRAKAFRKIVRRKTATEAPKASQLGASPSLTQKKRPQRSSQGQMFGVEDNKRFFPWLDIVEHLIIVDALNPEAHSRHMRACKELVTSLNHVYQVVEAGEKEAGPGRQTVETLMTRSISTLFAGPWLSFVGGDGTGMSPQQPSRWSMPATLQAKRTSRKMALSPPPRHESAPLTSIHTPSTSNSQQLLGSLDFRSARMGVTDFLTSPLLNQEATIEVFLEEDTAFSKEHCMADFNRSRKKYIQESCAGLMHLPFSLLVYTAPILLTGTFASLKEVAWAMILDSDQSLAQAAGCFFLLAAAKEGDSAMKEFFYHKVEKASHQQQKEAMGRFMALWQFRYKVWPSMEERGQKKFNAEREREEREDQQTIGYSLPANLLGSPGRDVPVAPWTALSVCIHQDCQKNPDKCYRATRLAPLRHRQEVSKSVENFSVSGLSLSQEADSKPTSVYYGVGSEDTAGNININQWEAVEPTLFPPSLLPLIQFVISSLTPHTKHTATSTSSTSDQQSLSISELARQAIWQCMVEDSRLLFRPLLNRFNKLYQDISDKKNKVTHAKFTRSLADILHPIHHILKSFAILPPRAAHFLFNNFVGIITRHTDQPCPYSAEIIESVLSLLTMVVPSVQGLDLKMLKSVLKKESCYTTILTTARIRGAERIQIIDETNMRSGAGIPVTLDVEGDSTFGQLIASFKDVQLSYELLQRLYLVDQSKELPVLSSLVVQDHYSVTSDKQCPTFLLREVGRGPGREVWSSSNQLDQLFVHKMSDILRVLLTVKLLATGPDVEKGFTYNEFAQPNYRFLHQELVALNSFPRKALTSVRYEAGSTSLTQHHLRSADSMLMGTWVKFVLDLFLRAKPDYEWGNSMTLFLNVINGALLLYSEDLSILRRGLASLLIAASKFVPAFKKHGYELVILTLIQTYGSHLNNSLVTGALKFIWGQFYALNLNSNVFLLQAISATAILLSEDAAKLSTSYGTPFFNYLHAQQIDPILAQRNHARAAFELMEALDSETAPPDELDVRSFCPLDQEPWQPLTLQTTFYLCITLASWNPEAIRGMQMLVFLDHLMPMFLKSLSMSHHSNFTSDSVRLLVKGCESITKPQSWKGDFLATHKGKDDQHWPGQQNLDEGEERERPVVPIHRTPERKTSTVAKIYRRLVNPNKGMSMTEGSVYFPPTVLPSNLPPIGHQEYVGEFKRRRLQAANQRVLQLSRESLLSLVAKFASHEVSEQLKNRPEPSARAVIRIDAQTILFLTTISVQLLKQGASNEVTLTSRGLCSFMETLLPNVEWTDAYFPSFQNIIARLVKLFRVMQRIRIILAWDSLGSFLRGVTSCIERNPQLAAHEQIFLKLKALLEVIMNVSSQSRDQEEDPGRGGGGGGRGGGARQRRHLLHSAPTAFCDVVVGLVAQLMLSTRTAPYPRLRYRLSDLLSQKLTIKDAILPKILLPLCIQLGLRDDLQQLPREDTDFLLQLLDKKVENTLKLARHQFHPCHFLDPSRSEIPADMFFRAIKVFSCAFSESFSLQDWSRITQWVHSLSLRKLDIIKAGSQFEQAGHERRGSRQSRHSSVSSVTGHHNLDSYVAFHKALLFHVYESLLSMYHVPLFSFLWPLLGRLEVQLTEAERGIKTENPGQLQGIRSCIDKCQSLRRDGPAPKTTKSKNALLHSYQEEMKTPTQHQFKRASTMVDRKRPKHAIKKRLSYQLSLPSIGEEELRGEVDRKGGSAAKKSIEARPTFLGFSNLPPEETRVKKPAILLRDEEVRKKAKFLTEEQQAKVSTLSSSDTSPSQKPPAVKHFVRKSALKKHTAESNTLSPLNDSPEPSPKFKRKVRRPLHSPKPEKSKRNPPLGRLRDDSKFTSSEIQADVEDFDVGSDTMGVFSPQTEQSLAAGRERSGVSVVNKTAIEMSVPSAAEGGNMLLVEAEVHHDLNSLARSPSPAQQPPSSVVVPSPSLLPPPPPLTDSRSSSPSRTPPSLPSPPPPFHSPPLTFTSPPQTEDPYHTHDLDSSNDLLLPRDRTGSSPPLHVKNSRRVGSPWHEQSPCDNETETDMDTLLPHSSSSSLTRKLSSPTNLKRLSFDRRQSKEKEGVSFKSMQDDSTC